MSTEVGRAYVTLLPSAKDFGSNVKKDVAGKASAPLKEEGDKAGKAFSSGFLPSLRGIAVGLGALAVAGGFVKLIGDARTAAKETRLTEQVIKSTGGAAHVTAASVTELADAISNKTGVDDDTIRSGENLLLTFTNIRNEVGKGNDIFNQATQSVTDMSVALGQDTKSSAIQLGKALNDPIKGVTALQRVGVSFTESQKKQIKTLVDSGKTLDAQKLILHEIGREFGGAAAAASDPIQKLQTVLLNIGKSIAGDVLPFIEAGAAFISNTFIPVIKELVQVVGVQLRPIFAQAGQLIQQAILRIITVFTQLLPAARRVFGQVVALVRQVVDVFVKDFLPVIITVATFIYANIIPALITIGTVIASKVIPVISGLVSFIDRFHTIILIAVAGLLVYKATMLAMATAGKIITAVTKLWAAAQLLLDAALDANIFALVVVAIVGLVAAIIYAWTHFQTFRDIVINTWNAIKVAAAALWSFLQIVFNAVWTVVKIAVNIILIYITLWIDYIKLLINIVLFFWHNAIIPAFDAIKAAAGKVWTFVQPIFKLWGLEIKALATVFTWLWKTVVVPVFNGIKSVISAVWNGGIKPIFDLIKGAIKLLGAAFNGISTVVSSVFNGIVNIVRTPINLVIGLFNKFIDAINSVHIHIPSIGPFGGFDFGLHIPHLPLLDSGGLTTEQGLFQQAVKNELHIPLDDPRAIAKLRGALGGGGHGRLAENLILQSLNPDELAAAVYERQRRQDILYGVPA